MRHVCRPETRAEARGARADGPTGWEGVLSVFARHGHAEAKPWRGGRARQPWPIPTECVLESQHRHARKTRAHCSPGPCVSAFQSHVSRAGSPAAGPDTPPPPAHRWSALCRASCHPADGQHLPLHGLRALPRTLQTMRGGTVYPWVPVCAAKGAVHVFLLDGQLPSIY